MTGDGPSPGPRPPRPRREPAARSELLMSQGFDEEVLAMFLRVMEAWPQTNPIPSRAGFPNEPNVAPRARCRDGLDPAHRPSPIPNEPNSAPDPSHGSVPRDEPNPLADGIPKRTQPHPPRFADPKRTQFAPPIQPVAMGGRDEPNSAGDAGKIEANAGGPPDRRRGRASLSHPRGRRTARTPFDRFLPGRGRETHNFADRRGIEAGSLGRRLNAP
jgi:hypothetical protein